MSHAKYTTEAFVLSKASRGESDIILSLFTKDFGLISAVAKSSRMLKSKLKPYLEEGNFLQVSLVKGKEVWRLTEVYKNDEITFPSQNFSMFLKILKLVKSLVQGEEKNLDLFETLKETYINLVAGDNGGDLLDALECVTVMKILDSLGYGREKNNLGISFATPINSELLLKASQNKKELVYLINKTLTETHL